MHATPVGAARHYACAPLAAAGPAVACFDLPTLLRTSSLMAASALHTEFLSIGPGVSGYLAKPSGVPGIGVVVMMEAFGLNAFVKGVCERFAKAGYMRWRPTSSMATRSSTRTASGRSRG